MADTSIAKPQDQTPEVQSALSGREAVSAAEATANVPLPDMTGRVNRHTSGYWALTIPALSVRYLAEAGANVLGASRHTIASKIKLPIPYLQKGLDKLASLPDTPEGNKAASRALDKLEAPIVGSFMMVVSSLYLKRTYDDIKGAFAESIAWEKGKDPKDVGLRDVLTSDNTLVEAARKNFFKYNTRRFAVNSPFFSHLVAPTSVKPKDAILFGVAANSLYLMSDVVSRKETFFERLQSFVDDKILHTEQIGNKITANDLINLYELHSRDKNQKYSFSCRMDTQEWSDRTKIFTRMADLMNQTYGNEPNKENANFTLPKMIYLMGHGLINSSLPERSCAFIELANHNGMEAVKEAAKQPIKDGADVKYAQEHYPISQAALSCTSEKECALKQEQPKNGFASRFAAAAAMSQVDKVNNQRAVANESAFVQSA